MKANAPCIAVLDDEADLRRALARLLGLHGYAVELFADGESFLAANRRSPSDCAVVDLQMREMRGFAVLERLATPEYHRVPVIIVTGSDRPGYRERAKALGVRAYLTKPVDEESLVNAIRACL
ncbi:MAG: response regulator [Halioglobus sp.]|nr:response regulator [Halioglobus sp.]